MWWTDIWTRCHSKGHTMLCAVWVKIQWNCHLHQLYYLLLHKKSIMVWCSGTSLPRLSCKLVVKTRVGTMYLAELNSFTTFNCHTARYGKNSCLRHQVNGNLQLTVKNDFNLWKILMITMLTRSSADADNRLDAFSGQSRSTNMVPFHMLHMVSYCANSNFVF